MTRAPLRLGVYSDLAYRRDGETLSTHQAFVRFVTALPPRVDEVVLFGRLDPRPGRSHYVVSGEGVRFVPLPHYPAVTALAAQGRAARRSMQRFRAELDRLDAVWIFGPHPMAVLLALVARRRGTPLFLGVRQDYPTYIANRLPGRRWAWAVPVARGLERSFRRLARDAPTVALGEEIARGYRTAGARVLSTGFSLVRRSELVALEDALAKPWDEDLRLLTVGRVAPEKNPLLLPEIMVRLRARTSRWRLAVAGDGPLMGALAARAAALGVEDAIDLLGYVPSGPELAELYAGSHAFLHVSLTEGLPQVLWEAQGAGLPVVATEVGGVPAAVGRGTSALLVPPGDAGTAADAVTEIGADEALRRRLIAAGLENAMSETMEAQLDRLADFFRSNLRGRGGDANA